MKDVVRRIQNQSTRRAQTSAKARTGSVSGVRMRIPTRDPYYFKNLTGTFLFKVTVGVKFHEKPINFSRDMSQIMGNYRNTFCATC